MIFNSSESEDESYWQIWLCVLGWWLQLQSQPNQGEYYQTS